MKSTYALALVAAFTVLVNPLAALAEGGSADAHRGPSPKPQESIAALGAGSIEIAIHQVDGTKQVIDFRTDLESIVGATITVPGQKKNLVSLRASGYENEERIAAVQSESEAVVGVSTESLAGPHLHVLLPLDLSQERVLQLTLHSKTGGSHLVRLHKDSWGEGQVTLNLTGSGSCITYTSSCTGCGGGTIQKECCGGTLDACIDCAGCKIDCDQRCTATVGQ